MKKKLRISSVILVLFLFCSAFMFVSCGNATDKAEVTFLAGSIGNKVAQNMPDRQKVTIGQKATKPTSEPTIDSGTFKAWADLATGLPFDFNTVIEKDVTLYAQWSQMRSITFNKGLVGEDKIINLPEKQFVEPNERAEYPAAALFRKGYTFTGWYTQESGGDRFNFKSAVTKNVELFAQWKKQDKETFRIACIGDSLTVGDGGGGQTYPKYLEQQLGEGNAVGNFGASGYHLTAAGNPDYQYNKHPKYEESLTYNPDVIVIMLGTNDSNHWDVAKLTFHEEFRAFIELYQTTYPGVNIMMMTSPPVVTPNKFGLLADVIKNEICAIQLDVAMEYGLGIIDLHNEIVDNNLFAKYVTSDNVHFNANGYKFIAEFVAEKVRNQMGIVSSDETFNITFNKGSVGEDEVLNVPEKQIVKTNKMVEYPAEALFRKGYTFTGWYTQESGGERFNFKSGVTKNVELFAHWEKGKETLRITCVGDSITQGDGNAGNYPKFLKQVLGGENEVINCGISSSFLTNACDTISGKHGRKYTQIGGGATYNASLNSNPNVMIIMLGTNDSQAWDVAKLTYEKDLKELIGTYQTKFPGVSIMLMTSPPTNGDNTFGIKGDIIKEHINPIQREAAHELGLGIIDLHNELAKNDLDKLLKPDKVHPTSKEGNEFLAQYVAQVIRNHMGIEASSQISNEVDLVLFAGQSNMAGRGEANQATLVPKCHAYEYKAITDPDYLWDLAESFGVKENKAVGANDGTMKTGSMVSTLCESYYDITKTPIVAVSCYKGG